MSPATHEKKGLKSVNKTLQTSCHCPLTYHHLLPPLSLSYINAVACVLIPLYLDTSGAETKIKKKKKKAQEIRTSAYEAM